MNAAELQGTTPFTLTQHTQGRSYIIVQIITYKSKELKYNYSNKIV